MTTLRPFRFGHQVRPDDPTTCIAEAQQAEAAGFDVVTIPDHVGSTMHSPLVTAAAMAQATTTIRFGTFVLNNEMRNPVQLAWEAVALDHISGGRFELGLGAGHTPHEFVATGIDARTAAERKARLVESFGIIRQLLDGETVDHDSPHYCVEKAELMATVQERLPIMLAGNGERLLRHAGEHADIVGLNGLGRRLADGHRHAVKFGEAWLQTQIEQIAAGAASHPGQRAMPELNALVQRVVVTDDREAAAVELAAQVEDLDAADALTTPYVAIGTTDEIIDHFSLMRERHGISYFVTRDLDAMTPVVAALGSSNR